MHELTQRQIEVLEIIKEMMELHSMPPTVAEIAARLGVKSTNGIRGHLQALERKGAIELIPNASRGIRLLMTDQGPEESGIPDGIPIVGRVAAGSPILAEQHIEEYWPVDASQFNPSADYLLRVHGMSMRDVGILDGDLLAVHRTPVANNGQIVVARIDDEVTVKRFTQRGSIVRLKAENPEFAAIKVDLRKESLAIEGVAVGLIRHIAVS